MSAERRVLFVRPGSGGVTARSAIDHYAEVLAARPGYRVFYLGDPQDLDGVEYLGTFPASSDADVGSPLDLLAARRRALQSALQRSSAHLVHLRNFVGDFLLVAPARAAGAAAVVLDIRTLAIDNRKHALLRLSAPVTTRRFDHVFVLNDAIRRSYVPWQTRVSELPLGFDPKVWWPGAGPPPTPPLRCVYSGVLHAERRLQPLLAAVVRVLGEGVRLELHVYGNGPAEAELRALAVPGIHFHGHVDAARLGAALRGAHVGLAWVPMTPRFDANVPLKTVETLACGVPVIASRTAGNARIVRDGHTGLLIDATEAALAAALRALAGGGLQRLERSACAASVAQMTWERLAERWLLPVYARLLG